MPRGEIIPSLAAGLALLAVASASAHAAGYSEFLDSVEFRGFRAEASYTSDSNVTRAPAGDALRDGYRHAFGVTVQKPVTDRVQLFGALTRNISDGKSAVFDTRSTSLRGNADWSLGRWDTVYLGAEYRTGDSVSTVSRNDPVRTLGFVNTAGGNIIQDDAFNDTTRDAYRLKARTLIATLGYNRAFGERHALDVSWRRAQSSVQNAVAPAGGSDLRYTVNQYALAYLVRF